MVFLMFLAWFGLVIIGITYGGWRANKAREEASRKFQEDVEAQIQTMRGGGG